MFAQWFLLAALAAPQQRADVFRVEVENVLVDVFVGRKGQAVLDLTAEDFEVRDNGVPQTVELIDATTEPVGAVLVFDTSASILGEKLSHLKRAARTFLAGLDEEDQAAVLGFSSYLHLESALSRNQERLATAVSSMKASGLTCLYDALYVGLSMTDEIKRSLLVLFSDGHDTFSWLDGDDIVEVARRSSAVVYVISTDPAEVAGWLEMMPRPLPPGTFMEDGKLEASLVLSRTRSEFFRRIADISGGRVLYAGAPSEYETTFRRVLTEFKTSYLLSYAPTGVSEGGWHEIDIEVKSRDLDVRARRGYWRR